MHALAKRIHPKRIRRTLGAARCVTEPSEFVRRELRDVPCTREYRLRESGLHAAIRHPLLDMWVLEELFRFKAYAPPEPVMKRISALGRPPRVLDVGGHVGLFGLYAFEVFGDPEIVSFEPDPRNVRLLRRCIQANGLERSWRVVEACAGTGEGEVDFQSSFHLSRAAPASDPPLKGVEQRILGAYGFLEGETMFRSESRRVPSRDVFPFMDQADLIKIDAEGAEWEILADPRLVSLKATAAVLEYHPAYYRASDPDSLVESRLKEAGYEVGARRGGGDARMLWAWKSEPPSSPPEDH